MFGLHSQKTTLSASPTCQILHFLRAMLSNSPFIPQLHKFLYIKDIYLNDIIEDISLFFMQPHKMKCHR